jgi:hypothetical protein
MKHKKYKPCGDNGLLPSGSLGGGGDQGLLLSLHMKLEPSEEESHRLCECHLLNCDEGQGQ